MEEASEEGQGPHRAVEPVMVVVVAVMMKLNCVCRQKFVFNHSRNSCYFIDYMSDIWMFMTLHLRFETYFAFFLIFVDIVFPVFRVLLMKEVSHDMLGN
jgi:hypothetical protein